MPADLHVTLTGNRNLGGENFLLEFHEPGLAASARPGQFLMIGIPESDLLLRRPFSVCGLPGTFGNPRGDEVHVLYRVAGRGTGRMAELRPGDPVTVLGPLGHGFDLEPAKERPSILVAGGIGIAPFPALVVAMESEGIRPALFYGARSAANLPLLDWFRDRCPESAVVTEDGSAGDRGMVTAPLEKRLDAGDLPKPVLFACGPEPMLRAVARLSTARHIPCQLSLEARMACGFGACLACVVPVRARPGGEITYERACMEGPVMSAERLAW